MGDSAGPWLLGTVGAALGVVEEGTLGARVLAQSPHTVSSNNSQNKDNNMTTDMHTQMTTDMHKHVIAEMI